MKHSDVSTLNTVSLLCFSAHKVNQYTWQSGFGRS